MSATQPSNMDEEPIAMEEKTITSDEKPAVMDEKPTSPSEKHSPSAFDKLPDEIIEQILQLTDPNSFASLVLLNSKWRRVSHQAHLYAHHLLLCESYGASHSSVPGAGADDEDNLPKLQRLFAREVKRNLFEAYLRPRTTTIKLISNCIGSSSAPGGEGMQFSPSPKGHHILAYNSSRIFVLDIREPELAVKREFKILRRPAAACVLDDASLLAVLSTDMQIDLYDLSKVPPRRLQSLILDNSPRAIALSPCGSVLAAAYEGGIEVSSISPGALPTDRRAVKCDGVDSLAFSCDGTQLLGTTTTSHTPNTVILTAPYYDPGNQMSEENNISALWTTSILFPNTSRDCSHAVLLQESTSMEATWTFTYDRSFETFRAVRIDDLRNGTTYFTGPCPSSPSPGPLLPCTLPAANYQGDLVSAGFDGNDVWLYGVPEDLEAVPENTHTMLDPSGTPSLQRMNSGISARSSARVQETSDSRVPQWQILCDKLRNTFVSGRKVAQMSGVSTVKWVSGFGDTSLKERLVIAARGVMPPKLVTEEDGIDFVDGGRVTILDFDYGLEDGEEKEITIEVGSEEPEVLEEEHRDIDTEVAIVRRRTQRRGNNMSRNSMMSIAASTSRQVDALLRPSTSHVDEMEDPLVPRPMATARRGSRPALEETEDVSLEEAQEALDAPYAHANPRSGPTLRRAATAAAVNRRRNPQPAAAGRVEYRRADGRAEHPHESDADNWVPPPPPYTKEDPGDLPAFMRHSAIPGVGLLTNNRDHIPPVPPLPSSIPPVPPLPSSIPPVPPLPTSIPPVPAIPLHHRHTTRGSNSSRPELPRLQTSPFQGEGASRMSWNPHFSQHRAAHSAVNVTRSAVPTGEWSHRPVSRQFFPQHDRPAQDDVDDIYDVSPVGTPSRATSSHVSEGPAMANVTPERPSPYPQSIGVQSAGPEFTPTSSRSHPFMESSRPGSANPYAFDPTVPPLPVANLERWNSGQSGSSPVVGRLPNAQTWPRAPAPPQSDSGSLASLNGYPRSAPASNQNNEDIITASLPPAPHPDQLARLHRRQDSTGAPRPASGSFQFPRVPVGSRSQNRDSRRYSGIPEAQQSPPPPGPEQPLIISTPTGVTGAFDAPGQPEMGRSLTETILHAPVPRHPRPVSGAHLLRPTVERLETISSASNGPPHIYPPGPPSSQLPSTPLRHHTSLNRRQSRARRGALKNIQDAKLRGWTGRKKKQKKDEPWTDVTWASLAPRGQNKDRKCIVM
ncbi:uncharacterized protein F4822DRAFT_225043 [Hypoxylon trugodes]|uniref:uncharacterized protein n=1 Tax=Hypoxylon trugodes TaxID=326681 RepID=UPI0021A045C1|nr:uncharacterized protein F4822DRAFT_225043 [Hypoxylon trugodes]KAI1390131.1 hypothetical protein F4822DRAFT_225043 [Hypoxylon trugodes]